MAVQLSCIPERTVENGLRDLWFTQNVPCLFAVRMSVNVYEYNNRLLPECSVYYLASLCFELVNV